MPISQVTGNSAANTLQRTQQSSIHNPPVSHDTTIPHICHMTICHVEKFLHMTDFFSTGTACGARDKYEVGTQLNYCWGSLDWRNLRNISKEGIQAPVVNILLFNFAWPRVFPFFAGQSFTALLFKRNILIAIMRGNGASLTLAVSSEQVRTD